MKHVWLCGASEKVSFEESNRWREECVERFKDNSKYFRAWNPNDYYNYDEQLHKSDTEIIRFCYNKVEQADVILVNLQNIRQSVGSLMEIAWAYLLRKPIVGFLEDDHIDIGGGILPLDLKNVCHPWVIECCDRIETGNSAIEDALYYIETYYGE
ncbi:nucleoside 2-deoxyribosyltransferase [Lacrimispora indolis]|uniref:nucleoside 2-deoxyribosyltransferase n=1 Tax=Lacrimispora indolis TaxID=69825 RepID=UPI000409F6D4|nr:nucleoside 2-deoxyribosyltransferase [[Clostridium] methoxybenzovorans]